ncbi:MAG: hypothetical protein KDA61_09760 [Planctomycetales bacterium]|nr:hypothetical protein [Planctomycetales bacterium]
MHESDSTRVELSGDNVVATEAATSQVPRLRITYLLLWTFCSAIYLALQRYWATHFGPGDQYEAAVLVSALVGGMVNGAALTGVIILARTRLGVHEPLCREPGHWLALVVAFTSFFKWVTAWLLGLAGAISGEAMQPIYCFVLFVTVVICLWASGRVEDWRWKPFFAATATLTLMKLGANAVLWLDENSYGLFEMMHRLYSLSDLVLCLWVVVISATERREHIRRDWLHWAGVAVFAVSQYQSLMWMIAMAVL